MFTKFEATLALHQVKMPVVLKGHLAEELLKMEEPKVQS